jgi:hypothetical protein
MRIKLASRGERWWFTFSHTLALAIGLFVSYAALEHNPQEEFCTYVAAGAFANYSAHGQPCLINWGPVSWVFLPFLLVALILFFYAPYLVWRLSRRHETAAL